jgi:two-component system response regulator YesN
MYNVLIVDDDKLILQDLVNLIDWHKYGFNIVGEAYNGVEALKIVNAEPVDLIITDIYMPKMNGVELVRNVKKTYPHINIIIISNYDDFSYVKEAMKLGASDYVLKYEIQENSLITLLNSCRLQILEETRKKQYMEKVISMKENARDYLVQNFWRKLFNNEQTREELEASIIKIDATLLQNNYLVNLVELFDNKLNISNKANEFTGKIDIESLVLNISEFAGLKARFVIPVSRNKYVVLFTFKEKSIASMYQISNLIAAEIIKEIQLTNAYSAVVTIGSLEKSLWDLGNEYRKIVEASKEKFYKGLDKIINLSDWTGFCDNLDDDLFQHMKIGVINELNNSNREKAINYLKEWFLYLSVARNNPELLINSFIELDLSISRLLKERGMDNLHSNEDFNQNSYNKFTELIILQNIENYFIRIIDNIVRFSMNISLQKKRFETVKAVEFILKHYMNEITLNSVAEYVGLSRNYFCKLFKDDTGENFIDFLNKVRIEKAKYIIQNSSCRVQEIASDVGFDDYRYFTKVFRQYTGSSPSDFRKAGK